MKQNYIKFLIIGLFLLLLIINIYFIIYNKINIYYLFYSLFIIIIVSVYKWVLDFVLLDEMIIFIRKKDNNEFFLKNFEALNEKFLKKNIWLIKPIYYLLYYFPTNWPYLIILWVARKWWKIRLFITSKKDVIGKFYFNKEEWFYFDINSYYVVYLFKKYVIGFFFNFIYFILYLKFNLLSYNWNRFFQYRVFGILYSTILIATNLHFFLWFRNTDYFLFLHKLILVSVFLYFILLIFVFYINKRAKYINLDNLIFNTINEKKGLKREMYFESYKYMFIRLNKWLEEKNVANNFFLKDYLIFMCLAERYISFFDNHYGLVISKNWNKSNINLPSNLILLGRIGLKNEFNFIEFYNEKYKMNMYFNNVNSFIWIIEKNYRISFILYSYLMNINYNFLEKYLNYEIYKTLYGARFIEDNFKYELAELESFHFIYVVWNEWLSNDISDSFKLSNNFIINKDDYYKILDLFNFFFLFNKVMLFLDYEVTFSGSIAFDINFIISDIEFHRESYGNDLVKFVTFWKKSSNSENDIWFKFQKEAFLNHIPNMFNRSNIVIEKAKTFYNLNLKSKTISEIIIQIELIQNEHKNKYFFKKPKLTVDVLADKTVLHEWSNLLKKE